MSKSDGGLPFPSSGSLLGVTSSGGISSGGGVKACSVQLLGVSALKSAPKQAKKNVFSIPYL
jgi:hypothetical protein